LMTLQPVQHDAYIESRLTWSRLAVPHGESIIFFSIRSLQQKMAI
jgi:hypothetical protein